MTATAFKGLSRGPLPQIPSSPLPSPEIDKALDVGDVFLAAIRGVDRYQKESCPTALAGSFSLSELAKRAGSSDLLDRAKELELELDALALTKAPLETIKEKAGRWEVLIKGVIRAVAIARARAAAQRGELA